MALRARRSFLRTVVAAIVGLALSAAGDAAARKFQMSGNWVIRNGLAFIPMQFANTAGPIIGKTSMMVTPRRRMHISMGNLTGAFHFPNDVIPGGGVVTATGSAPATLRVRRNRFSEDAMFAFLNRDTNNLVQITTDFGIRAPYATATLAAGAGPGSFTWCPQDPACVAAGGMLMTDKPQGAGARNGRVIYRKGANQFGGAMQMGLRRGGVASLTTRLTNPIQIQHIFFSGYGDTERALAPGGLGSPDDPVIEKLYLPPNFVTQPTMFTFGKLISHPGGKVTTMGGVTTMGATGPLLLPSGVLLTTPMGKRVGEITTNYGFAHTTGTVFGQQSVGTNGSDFFTFMGYDKRTPLGAGNIQTVAGGISWRNTAIQSTPYATMHRVRMTLGSPVPSMSPAGFAAAGLLVLLAAGYALRRRFA